MDNPSIYLGGKSLTESDAGLNFNVGHESIQDIKMLNYGSKKVAYRPFYRYIYSEVIDDNGNVTRINKNIWKVASPLDFDYYYFPGDVVKMSVYSPLENYLQLRIEVLEETKIEKYQKKRKKYQLKGKPKVYYSPLFYSEGHSKLEAEFKRVNSLDQYGNEGFIVKPTKALVSESVWKEVFLFKKINESIVKIPFSRGRYASMICPNDESFTIKEFNKDEGGEKITIHPQYRGGNK
ncbi:MAG: hypothetical protein RBS76_00660 [Acholeplasmatales bacterium]|nr:hypothetical protein [Acholeplasmatales bacterium]